MTTRQLSRSLIGITALALIAFVLFSGPIVSAGKGDRAAPTVPSNLIVTGFTETSVSLKWQASSDNSGKFSYRVRITNLNNSGYNSLATVSQSQTTYTAKFLAMNSSYTFNVYAIDENGNRSADSNTASANTLADTTPPTGPVLEAAVLSPSQVQLTWTKSTDNVANHCCNYDIIMNGSRLTQNINWAAAPTGKLSAIIRHVAPGSANSFSVSAIDWSGGNASNSNAVNVVMPPTTDTLPPTVPTNVRVIRYEGGIEVWLGWTESSDNKDAQENVEYEIYVNGVISPLAVSSGVDFDFVYASSNCDNTFTVKAVDKSGNSSAASAPVKLFLWPC